MSRLPQLRRLADERCWPLVSIADLVDLRRRSEALVDRVVSTRLPTAAGEFTAHGYRSQVDGSEHVALVHGDVSADVPLVRVHSECLTGDVFGSLRCDCGPQLEAAQSDVVRAGAGVIVYVRGHEGRGIGLVDKLRAYAAQDAGADTVDANSELGLPVDARDYTHAAQVLRDAGVVDAGGAGYLLFVEALDQVVHEQGAPTQYAVDDFTLNPSLERRPDWSSSGAGAVTEPGPDRRGAPARPSRPLHRRSAGDVVSGFYTA